MEDGPLYIPRATRAKEVSHKEDEQGPRASRTGPRTNSNGPKFPLGYVLSHQSSGRGKILIPPISDQERTINKPASHGSGEADVYQLGSPPRRSCTDQDPALLIVGLTVVKCAVNHFASALMLDMTKFPEELDHLKQAICREVKAEIDKANHWEFMVQAFVCQRLFEGFDTKNGFFGIEFFNDWRMTSINSFADFSTFENKAATISRLLTKGSPDESFLGKFCFKKFKSITGDLATNLSLPLYQGEWMMVAREQHPRSKFYQSFLQAAVSVWLLHRLVHSFEQGWTMLGWETYPAGSKFQRKYMESVPPLSDEEEVEDMEVGFLVIPGFKVNKNVAKCNVYLSNTNGPNYPGYEPSRQLGSLDGILIPPMSKQGSSSEVFSQLSIIHGPTSTSVSQGFSEPLSAYVSSQHTDKGHEPEPKGGSGSTSGSWPRESSELISANTAGNDLEGRPDELSDPFQEQRESDNLGGPGPQEISEPLPAHELDTVSESKLHKPSELSPNDSIIEDVVKTYTWDQILVMTNGLTSRRLGKGGFGTVYLGKLENKEEVAVKILDASSQQGIPEFLNEVNLLKNVNHVNLVKLLGYCQAENHVLIYEFAEEGSVWDHLQGGRKCLDWKQRLSIALHTARGLEYLHIGCSPRIIHRDIKSQNILLTKSMVAKVADFGVSKVGSDPDNFSKTHVTTMVRGSRGYLDPEYVQTGQLREKSDVYSFGVVLLEIITGRKPIQNSDQNCFIGSWVEKHCSSGSISSKGLESVADPTLGGHYNRKALKLVINVAKSCIQQSGTSRPDMSEVVRVLENAQKIELADEKKSSWLRFL